KGQQGTPGAAGRGVAVLAGTLPAAVATAAGGEGQGAGAGRRADAAVHRTGAAWLDPPGVLAPGQALCGGGRYRPGADQSAWPAAQFRHPPAEPWRRPARAADAAGPQLAVHHADLHAGRTRTPAETARPPSSTRLNPCRACARHRGPLRMAVSESGVFFLLRTAPCSDSPSPPCSARSA